MSVLREVAPHPFQYTQAQRVPRAPNGGKVRITTANVGMLPAVINFFQGIGGLFSSESGVLLRAPKERASVIASRLIHDKAHVVCLQEAFDTASTRLMSEQLAQAGYHVLHSGRLGIKPVNSGLLVASLYPIQHSSHTFFNHFIDPIHTIFGIDGIRRSGEAIFLFQDHVQWGRDFEIEARGTFYNMTTRTSPIKPCEGCLYDRVLLYNSPHHTVFEAHAEIRHFMQSGNLLLSDHLPVTTTFSYSL